MFDRIKRAIANWQDLAIWLPLMLGLLLATTYLLPRADPMAAVDGLGFLQGYAALLVKGGIASFKAKLDADEYGGAPLLGVNGVVIKAHGSSNAKAIKNAVRQAKACCENGMVEAIRENIQR